MRVLRLPSYRIDSLGQPYFSPFHPWRKTAEDTFFRFPLKYMKKDLKQTRRKIFRVIMIERKHAVTSIQMMRFANMPDRCGVKSFRPCLQEVGHDGWISVVVTGLIAIFLAALIVVLLEDTPTNAYLI